MNKPVMSTNNPWPKRTPMEKLFERFVFDSTRCYTCGSVVYAMEKRSTTNHVYHNRCFRCRICRRNLTGASLNEEGDDIYCTNCYRKKERGDCDNRDFRRAAKERAQFIYNHRHPDQTPPKENPRPPIQRGFSRQTSWTMRQLERRFLSHQEPPNRDFQKTVEKFRQSASVPDPQSVRETLSVLDKIKNIRRSLSLPRRHSIAPQSPLQFQPVYSPYPTIQNESHTAASKVFPSSNRVVLRKINSFQELVPKRPRSLIDSTYPRTSISEYNSNTIDSPYPKTPPSERNRNYIDSPYPRTPPSERNRNNVDSPYPKTPPSERNRNYIDSPYARTPPSERNRNNVDSPYPKTPSSERNRNNTDSSYPRAPSSERNQNNIRSAYGRTPPMERKSTVIIDLNKPYQSPSKKPEIFLFPDTPLTANRRRNNSGNYSINPLKIN